MEMAKPPNPSHRRSIDFFGFRFYWDGSKDDLLWQIMIFFSFIFKSDLQWAMGVYGGWLWVFVVVGGRLWQFCGCLWWLLRWVYGGC